MTTICLNPTSALTSHSGLNNGLNQAIANDNSLALRIRFVRGPSAGCNATITVNTMAGTGHRGGLPSGGYPYGTLIPGTPTTATLGGSIFNTCIPANTHGEFTSTDIAALSYMDRARAPRPRRRAAVMGPQPGPGAGRSPPGRPCPPVRPM